MEISTRRLRGMLSDVDDMHRDTMTTFVEEQGDLLHGHGANRRRFVSRAALTGAVVTMGGVAAPLSNFVLPAGAQEASSDDLALFLARFEFTAVDIYTTAAGAGLVPEGPLLDAATVILGHHTDHAKAFLSLMSNAPAYEELTVIQGLKDAVVGQATAPDANVLAIAASVENDAETSYIEVLKSVDGALADTVASIAPVEAQHAVVLALAGGVADPGAALADNKIGLASAFDGTGTAVGPDTFA